MLARVEAFNDHLEKWLRRVLALLFAAFILVVFVQVIGRNLTGFLPLLWTTDVATILFVWSVFLGAAIACRRNEHYIIEIFPPGKSRIVMYLDVGAHVLSFSAIMVLIVAGFVFLERAFARVSLAVGISEGYFYSSIPIAAVLMVPFLTEAFLRNLRSIREHAQSQLS